MAKSSDDEVVTCTCPISYHTVTMPNGNRVQVLDGELPDIMEMCFGRCQRCGLPYHTEFISEEII